MKKGDREKVYAKYDGCCAYCGKDIPYNEMQVDHIKSIRMGGENCLENYNPSCRRCNHYKRSLDLEGFRGYMMDLHERIAKDYITKVGIDYGIVELRPFDGKFYFEKMETNTSKE